MDKLPTSKFLSLIPTLHENAVILDSPATEITPQSPDTAAVDQIEKTRRSSSSASESSVGSDIVSEAQGKQFLKLGL